MNKICHLLILTVFSLSLQAETFSFLNEHSEIEIDYNSIIEASTLDNKITVYNTGINLKAKHENGFSAEVRTAIDGRIDEIDSENFNLDSFVKELKANYEFETEDAVILLSIGKMRTGAKTDRDNPQNISGVMGIRLTVEPKKIPLLQSWMDAHDVKVTSIEITRYSSASKERLDTQDLTRSDMTAYALNLSKGRNLQTFFIYKRPDYSSYAPESLTVGGAYIIDAPLNPAFFAMYHQSDAKYLDLNILILSASFDVAKKTRGTLTWSESKEKKSQNKKTGLDFSLSHKLGKVLHLDVEGIVGIKVEQSNMNDRYEDNYYMRFEFK